MTERKKALIVLGIAIPIFSYGAFSFELGGANSSLMAASVAVSIAFGLFGIIGGLILLFTKNSLGLIETKTETDLHIGTPIEATLRKEELRNLVKDIPEESWTETIDDEFNKLRAKATRSDKSLQEFTKEKKMVKTKKEKPVEKSGSESIGLMKREKELVKRADELNALVNEVETELSQVRENLETKGWVNSDNGWVID